MTGSTGNDLSRWSIEVVNPHSGLVLAKVLRIVRGEREPTQARPRVEGRQPTEIDTHGRGIAKKQAVRADEEGAFFVGRSKIAGATAVELRRRQRQAGGKNGVPVGTAFAIFQGVIVRGKEF